MTFLQWVEQAGDATMMSGKGDNYDQGLQKGDGLAYRSPIIPEKRSRLAEKLDKLFGKNKSRSEPGPPR